MLTATFTAAVDTANLHVRRIVGKEAVSSLFEYVVELEAKNEDDPLAAVLGKVLARPIGVVYRSNDHANDHAHHVWGWPQSIEQMPTEVAGHPFYRVTMVPRLWVTTLTRRSRVFQDQSIPEIVAQILAESGFDTSKDLELRLSTSHDKLDFVAQYEETDFDFISRLLEREGIFYFFEQRDERETIVLGDANDAFSDLEVHRDVAFHARARPNAGEAVVGDLRRTLRHVPTAVVLDDYDWRNPTLSMRVGTKVEGGTAGVVFSKDEGYRSRDDGARLARIRAEELAARKWTYAGRSSLPTLHAGCLLSIVEHPIHEWDHAYVVTEVSHEIVQPRVGEPASEGKAYGNEFGAIDRAVPYRPERRTPRPSIDGLVYAIVDGPNLGAAAPIDEYGRYKVAFAFDGLRIGTGQKSRWIRRAQPHAGPNYGMHFPLRVGAEVLVAFVHGDPDRPIIVGAVPNVLTPSPVARNNSTANVLQTASGTFIEFEDNA